MCDFYRMPLGVINPVEILKLIAFVKYVQLSIRPSHLCSLIPNQFHNNNKKERKKKEEKNQLYKCTLYMYTYNIICN